MNPILIPIVFLSGGLLWLLCSFLYRPVGKIFKRLIDDAKEEMFDEEKEKKL